MPERSFSSPSYRYGFNGYEKDDEVKGNGLQYDYGLRMYDPRIGRFFAVDPLANYFSYKTPYDFAENTPIWGVDFMGGQLKTVIHTVSDPKTNGDRVVLETVTHINITVENPGQPANYKGPDYTLTQVYYYDKNNVLVLERKYYELKGDGQNIPYSSRANAFKILIF